MRLLAKILLAIALQGAFRWRVSVAFWSSRLGEIALNVSDPRCLGYSLIFDSDDLAGSDDENEFIDFFVQRSNHPLILMYPNTKDSLNQEHWQAARKDSKKCVNIIVVNEHNQSKLLALCRRLLETFYAQQITIVTEMSFIDAEVWLKEAQNEFLVLILHQGRKIKDVVTWKINHIVERLQLLSNTQVTRNDIHLSTGKDMLGRKLRVATLHFPPVVFIEEGQDPRRIYGIEPSVMDVLARGLNFSFEYLPVSPSEMWGSVIGDGENRTATGLLGALMKKEADVALGNLYLDYTRLAIIGFSSHYSIAEECLSVPAPRPYPKWMALYYPFTPDVWIGTVLSIVLSVLTLWLVAKCSLKSRLIDSYYNDITICFLTVAGHLLGLQQAQEIRLMANRLFLIWWLFGAFILSAGYRSGLISFMTFPYTPPPIDTIRQLVDSPLKKIIFDPLMKEILMKSNNSLQRELGRQFTTSDNLTYMFSLMDSAEWAVDSNLDSLRYEITNRYPPTSTGPRVHIMRECVFSMRAALGLQKNSPLKPYFDNEIEQLIEAGLIQYHRNRFAKKQNPWNPKASKELVPFSLNSQQGAFYAMAFCLLISFLAFIGELVHSFWQKRRSLSTVKAESRSS